MSGTERTTEMFVNSIEDAELRAQVQDAIQGKESIPVPEELANEEKGKAHGKEERSEGSPLHIAIKEMTVPQKIKLAIFGNQTARTLLIRDTNKQIQLFVLQNRKISEGEIQEISRNTNVNDLVYRAIANDSGWMKNYAIRMALICNPRTPIDISMKWVRYLNDKDLRRLAKSKSIPQVVASQCQKLMDRK